MVKAVAKKPAKAVKKSKVLVPGDLPWGLVALRKDEAACVPGEGIHMMYYDDDSMETDPEEIKYQLKKHGLPKSVLVKVPEYDDEGNETGKMIDGLDMAEFFAVDQSTGSVSYDSDRVPVAAPLAALVYLPTMPILDAFKSNKALAQHPMMSAVAKYVKQLAKNLK